MRKTFNFFYALLLAILGFGATLTAEDITLTTYYPAPYGAYEELTTTGKTLLAQDMDKSVSIGTRTVNQSIRLLVRDNTDCAGGAYAIYGNNSNPEGGFAVYGRSDFGTAVRGEAFGDNDGSTAGFGVTGICYGNGGVGVKGLGSDLVGGIGVSGDGYVGVSGSGNAVGGTGVSGSGSTGVSGSGSTYDFYASGAGVDYGTSSSIRWKNNIAPIDNALIKIGDLRGVYFDWDKEHGGRHAVGFIGEEVAKVLPEIVEIDPQDSRYVTGMDYSKITPLLLEGIKEQQKEIERQSQKITELQAEVELLKKYINK